MYFRANTHTKQHLQKKQAKESDYTESMHSTRLTYTVTRWHCSKERPDSHRPTEI